MPHVLALSNQKGGVGKTTVSRELAYYLAESGKKVLLIDTDPQGNLTKSLLIGEEEQAKGLFEALRNGIPRLRSVTIMEITPNLHLLAGNKYLSSLERSLVGEMDAYTRLSELLSGDEFQKYDYILIDTPPSLGILSGNALAASEYLIIPMTPSQYTMQGTNDLMETVAKARKNYNPDLKLLGVVINESDPHPVLTREIREEIIKSFKGKVFNSEISRSIKIEEAVAERRGVIERDTKSGTEFKALGEEIVGRIEKPEAI